MHKHALMIVFALALAPSAVLADPAPAQPATPSAFACPTPPAPPQDSDRPQMSMAHPALPPCVTPDGNGSRCRKGEVDKYNAAITAYNVAVNAWNDRSSAFMTAMNTWMQASNVYAHCEVNLMNASAPH